MVYKVRTLRATALEHMLRFKTLFVFEDVFCASRCCLRFMFAVQGIVRKSEVAIKVPRNKLSEKQISDFQKEVNILGSVFHPNICLFLGA